MPKSRNHRISIMQLGSGWAAVHLADYKNMDWHTDVVQTGMGRFHTAEEAAEEAKFWADNEGLPLEEIVQK